MMLLSIFLHRNLEQFLLSLKISKLRQLTYDIIDLLSHLTLRKIGLTEIKTISADG